MKRLTLWAALTALFISLSGTITADETIKVFYGKGTGTDKYMEAMKKAYELKYPGRKVELVATSTSGAGQSYETKSIFALSNDASVDVAFIDGFTLHSLASGKIIRDIPELQNWDQWSQFYAPLHESVIVDGRYYGMPVSTDTRILFYNKRVLAKAGIIKTDRDSWQPGTWQELLDDLKKIKTAKLKDTMVFWVPITKGEGASNLFEVLLWGTPDGTLMKDGKWLVSSQGIYDTFKFLKNLADSDVLPMTRLLDTNSSNMLDDIYVPKQQIAVYLSGNWVMNKWERKNKELYDIYGCAIMPAQSGQPPKYTTLSGGWILVINQKTRQYQAATDFLKLAGGRESSLAYVQAEGDLTPRSDTASMDGYPAFLKAPTSYLAYTHFRPSNEEYPIYSLALSKIVEELVTGEIKTPEDAVKSFIEEAKLSVGEKRIIEEPYK